MAENIFLHYGTILHIRNINLNLIILVLFTKLIIPAIQSVLLQDIILLLVPDSTVRRAMEYNVRQLMLRAMKINSRG